MKPIAIPARLFKHLHKIARWVETIPDCVDGTMEAALDATLEEYGQALEEYVREGHCVADVETGPRGSLWAIVESTDEAGAVDEQRVRLTVRGKRR